MYIVGYNNVGHPPERATQTLADFAKAKTELCGLLQDVEDDLDPDDLGHMYEEYVARLHNAADEVQTWTGPGTVYVEGQNFWIIDAEKESIPRK